MTQFKPFTGDGASIYGMEPRPKEMLVLARDLNMDAGHILRVRAFKWTPQKNNND